MLIQVWWVVVLSSILSYRTCSDRPGASLSALEPDHLERSVPDESPIPEASAFVEKGEESLKEGAGDPSIRITVKVPKVKRENIASSSHQVHMESPVRQAADTSGVSGADDSEDALYNEILRELASTPSSNSLQNAYLKQLLLEQISNRSRSSDLRDRLLAIAAGSSSQSSKTLVLNHSRGTKDPAASEVSNRNATAKIAVEVHLGSLANKASPCITRGSAKEHEMEPHISGQRGNLNVPDASTKLAAPQVEGWMPKGSEPQVCAFIGDCGSTGNRLQMFTSDDMCPDEVYIPLECGNGEVYPHIYAFAEPGGLHEDRNTFLLTMRQVVAVQASIGLTHSNDKQLQQVADRYNPDLLGKPGYLTDCFVYSLLHFVMSRRNICQTSTVELDATAGVRNFYDDDLGGQGMEQQREAYVNAITYINQRFKAIFDSYSDQGLKFVRFHTLNIMEEARLEGGAIRLWQTGVNKGEGHFLDEVAGFFSMGGKSSQFIRFKPGSTEMDGWILLPYGHKQASIDYKEANGDKEKAVYEAIEEAYEQADKKWDEDSGNGLWIGVTNTVLAALGIGLEQSKTYTYDEVLGKMKEALENIDKKDQEKLYLKMLVVKYWLEKIFNKGASFYFRHKWTLPDKNKIERCVFSEWNSAKAAFNDFMLAQKTGLTKSDVDLAHLTLPPGLEDSFANKLSRAA
mmetsp:Transcript_56680/g.90103  ORF Transcript_56680/g.90103 Transcript_56680/m.90103 type:complete len:686 (-) Transcript_56680:32-2089(-)